MDYSFTIAGMKEMDEKLKKMLVDFFKKMMNKHGQEWDEDYFDSTFEDAFIAGGKQYVELITDLFNESNIEVKNPLYKIIDGKLYKRIEN